jgi:hypothetical protein
MGALLSYAGQDNVSRLALAGGHYADDTESRSRCRGLEDHLNLTTRGSGE